MDLRSEIKMGSPIPLGSARKGVRGVVASVGDLSRLQIGLATDFTDELERRLLEIGFVEGALVEVLHEGFIGGDPIAIRVDDMSVALRRREANVVMVRPFI
jgi:ferrous iron transport protein A